MTRLHTPWKINMEPKNGGVWKMIFPFNWVNLGFHLSGLGSICSIRGDGEMQLMEPMASPRMTSTFSSTNTKNHRETWIGSG